MWYEISRLANDPKQYNDYDVTDMNTVLTFTYGFWNSMMEEQRLNIFSRHTVHLVGEQDIKAMPQLKSLQDRKTLSQYVCMETPRHVHGTST